MDKVDADGINAFRSALELAGDGLAQPRSAEEQLRRIIDELEERLQTQDELLVQKELLIEDLQKPPRVSHLPAGITPAPQPTDNISVELEKVKVQLKDALQERDELKEKYREALRKAHIPDSAEKKENVRLKGELKTLKESQQARIRAEREAERDEVLEEQKSQREGWHRMFTCLVRLATKSAATLSDHEADSQEIRNLARDLRSKPDEIRARLAMDELTYQDAFEELAPVLYAATGEISKFKKRSLPVTRVVHRAELLLETLDERDELSVTDAINIIRGDEGQTPKKWVVLRAMKQAETLALHKVSFLKGSQDGMPSRLVKKGGYP